MTEEKKENKPAEAPKTEAPKTEAPKAEAPKYEGPKAEAAAVKPEEAKKAKAELEKILPTGRIGLPDEIAGAAVYLASAASSYTTGTEIIIDGGMLLGSTLAAG